MIVSFKNRGTEDIYDGTNSKAARKTLPGQLHRRAGKVLDQLNGAVSLQSLSLPGLRLEKLYGDRKGQQSGSTTSIGSASAGPRLEPRVSKSSTIIESAS